MALFNWLLGRNIPPSGPDQHWRDFSEARPQPRPGASAASIHRHTPAVPRGDFRFIALDVETACSDVASICQIGLACVSPGNDIHTYSTLVNPGTTFDPFNIQLHGIGPEHVTDAPRFDEALEDLSPLLARHHLVQHSNFDKQALAAACRTCGIDAPDWRWADSVKIARRAWPELKGNGGHGLASLKKALGLQFQHHDAGEDARAAALVVLNAEAHLRLSFDDLVKPARKKRYPEPVTREGDPAGALAGSVVAFTGALSMSRNEAAEMAARVGMTVKASVTKQTTYLVVGDQDLTLLAGHTKSSKHRKAEEMQRNGHPVEILGETKFKALVSRTGPP